MRDPGELDLHRTPDVPPPPPPRYGLWGAVAALVVGALAAAYFVFRPPAFEPASVDAPPPFPAEAPPASPRPEPEAVDLPDLDASDALVQQLVRALSSNPDLAAWLVTPDLVRAFVRGVEDVANGVTPRTSLPFLMPAQTFQAAEAGERVRVAPESYRRYDRVTGVAGSVDAAGAARLYTTLKPLIDEAAAEIGYPPGGFERALERAIRRLLETPVVEDDVLIEPHGGVAWQFADPQLEALAPVQKQFLGMGPRNMRVIQDRLREFARQIGLQV